jgi:hypothetical protein
VDERREIFLRDISQLNELMRELACIESEICVLRADPLQAGIVGIIETRRDKLRTQIADLKARLGVQP